MKRLSDENDQAGPDGDLELWSQYQSLLGHPAWKDYVSRLLRLQGDYEKRILTGEVDRHGNDMTPYLRQAYGVLLQVLSIPAEMEKRKEMAEDYYIQERGLGVDKDPAMAYSQEGSV